VKPLDANWKAGWESASKRLLEEPRTSSTCTPSPCAPTVTYPSELVDVWL
jgi:hypothetical protein